MAWLNFNHAQSNSKKWPKKINLPQMKFLLKKQLIKCSCTPLILQKLKKFSQKIQSHDDAPFLGSKWSICPKQKYFWKILLLFSSPYWPLPLCKIWKKLSQQIQTHDDAPFLGPKWPISPNENFFKKSVNKHLSFHSCLSTCQKSKSDINLLMKYWQLKNIEISLAESHFGV